MLRRKRRMSKTNVRWQTVKETISFWESSLAQAVVARAFLSATKGVRLEPCVVRGTTIKTLWEWVVRSHSCSTPG